MADMPKWFDYEFYMNAKVAQLQAAQPAGDWTMAKLVDTFAKNGFLGEEGAYNHFVQYGAAEDVAPNANFNASEYYAAKAAQYYKVEPSDVTDLQIANVKAIIEKDGLNAWTHYVAYGSEEGVNPSNAFDADAYLAAKVSALGGDWNVESVAKAIHDAGMTVLEHYLTYAGTSKKEVPADATFPVPDDQKVPSNNPGETFTLTTGVDTFVGGASDDVFNATHTKEKPVVGALDSIDGGAGNDTLNVADTETAEGAQYSFPKGFTVKNVENINITSNGGIAVDLSKNADVTSIKGVAAGTKESSITASDSADVDLTVAGAAGATVEGGKAVSVTAGTGATEITGAGLTTVSVKGGGAATIDNIGEDATKTPGKGTTLTSVVLDSVNAGSTIKGEGLTDVTVKGATDNANTVTITNDKANHALTVNVDGTGYTAEGTEVQTTVADKEATAITVNASGEDSSLSLAGSVKVKSLTITGDAALTLAADLDKLTTIDGSAATGDLDLGTLNAKTTAVKTGAGDDEFTIKATTKVTVDAGAGDDVITLGAAIAAGSTINLGAGDDALLTDSGSVAASTKDAKTVIDGGDGFDTVSAALINAANAAQFHNFEALDLSVTKAYSLDANLLTASTLEALALSGGGTKEATVSNVAAGVDLLVSGENSGEITIQVKGAATGTADAFAIAFNDTAEASATENTPDKASAKVALNGIENLSVDSTGTGFVANTLEVTDDKLQTLTITGDKDLTLTFDGQNGTNDGAKGGAVNLIDGSAATGDLNINTDNIEVDSKIGLTVKTGSGDDLITLIQKATVNAGAGDDTITSSADGGKFTGGEGKDKFDVSAAVATGTTEATAVLTTITDFAAGDSVKLLADSTLTGATLGDKIELGPKVTNIDTALAAAVSTANAVTWFQYGNDTYIVANNNDTAFSADDLVIKLNGVIDLSNATLDGASDYLTLA